jgi:hypothetical protein
MSTPSNVRNPPFQPSPYESTRLKVMMAAAVMNVQTQQSPSTLLIHMVMVGTVDF